MEKKLPNQVKRITLPGKAHYPVNIYLLGEGKDALLIDTGYRETAREVTAQAAGGRISRILISHYHPDHSQAGEAIARETGAEIFAHPEEIPTVKNWFEGTEVKTLTDGEIIEFSGGELQVLGTPGHTRGHLAFFWKEEKILFSGDLVVGGSTTWVGPPDGDGRDYLASLERLQELEIAQILPGHGQEIRHPRKKIATLIRHRHMREEQILACLKKAELSLSELVREIYPVLEERFRLPALLTAAGYLNKLEHEGKVEAVSGDEIHYKIKSQ
ncbi:MAG: MBL fold metallo-hydrolase [bacterium]|nr:MBL fold metallo-hydrolase [bacterium]